MPTTRRRRLRERRRDFTVNHLFFLNLGYAFFVHYPYGNPHHGEICSRSDDAQFDEETCRADWLEQRDELMAHWMQDPAIWGKTNQPSFAVVEPGGPGTRPWAWWYFDAPEPRPVVGETAPGNVATVPRQVRRGGAVYETERAFLERHGLLSEDERAYLADQSKQS